MTLAIDYERSCVIIETRARGILARLAHDLRIEAKRWRGEVHGDDEVTAVFPVDGLTVAQGRRHGTESWGPRPEGDALTIEQKIRDEVFAHVREVRVTAKLTGAVVEVTVETPRASQKVSMPVSVTRAADVRVEGKTKLSLSALKTGEPSVPLGAIKLEDAVNVELTLVLTSG